MISCYGSYATERKTIYNWLILVLQIYLTVSSRPVTKKWALIQNTEHVCVYRVFLKRCDGLSIKCLWTICPKRISFPSVRYFLFFYTQKKQHIFEIIFFSIWSTLTYRLWNGTLVKWNNRVSVFYSLRLCFWICFFKFSLYLRTMSTNERMVKIKWRPTSYLPRTSYNNDCVFGRLCFNWGVHYSLSGIYGFVLVKSGSAEASIHAFLFA